MIVNGEMRIGLHALKHVFCVSLKIIFGARIDIVVPGFIFV